MDEPLKLGEVQETRRGFEIIRFQDQSGEPCSLQISSLAGSDVPGTTAIWIGAAQANPQIMHADAKKLGIPTTATTGFVPYPVPPEVVFSTRAHLGRQQVEALVSHLQRWLETGSFR